MTTDQPDVEGLKTYHIVCDDGLRRELVSKDEVRRLLIEAEERGYKAGYVEAEGDHAKITAQMVIEAENRGGVTNATKLINTFHDNKTLSDAAYIDMMTTIGSWSLGRLTNKQEGEGDGSKATL